MTQLDRLERLDLRLGWAKEGHDFTRRLAQENNIALLGETLNMSLEVEQKERRFERISADILRKDGWWRRCSRCIEPSRIALKARRTGFSNEY